MKPFYIKRKSKEEAEKAVRDHLNRSCELLIPVTEVKTNLKRSVSIVYYAKLRRVE